MKQFIAKNKNYLMGVAACLLIGTVTLSFQDSPLIHAKADVTEQQDNDWAVACKDTTPPEKKMRMKDFDKLNIELEQAMKTVAEKLKEIDWSKLNLQISEAMKAVDMEKIKASVEQSLKAVDMIAIEKDVQNALKEVNIEKLNVDIKQALQEAKSEMEKVNWEEMKKELAEASKEIEKAKLELKDLNVDKIMSEAKAGIEKAKAELKEMKAMFKEMEKDGLIKTKKGFSLEFKDGSLYIDGKKQSDEISEKYRKYAKDGKLNITIDKDNGKDKDVVEL